MSHLTDQFIHIFHYLFVIFLLLFLIPRFIFKKRYAGTGQQIMANFMEMVFILLILGYILVILKLLEFLSIIFLLVFTGSRLYQFRKKEEILGDAIFNTEAMVYDYFEGKYRLTQLFSLYLSQRYRQFKSFVREQFSTPGRAVETAGLFIIICFAFYIRSYDAIMHPAPSFIDQYTNLKWVKDIQQNQLFNDGIFPQGFNVFWAVFQEFSRIDALYMYKYTGPFIQIFIISGIFLVLYLLTGSRISGIAGLAVYALLGEYADPYFWQWQVAAAPATFAQIFFLPTIYFLVLYLRDGHRDAFYTMFAGMGIVAFVQPVVFLELLFFVCAVSLATVVFKLKKELSSISRVILWGGMAGVISLVPVLTGLPFQRNTGFSLTSYLQINPETSFYILPLPSTVPLILGLVTGFLWYVVFKRFRDCRHALTAERWVLAGTIVTALSFTTLQPVEPVKVDWDSSAAQYLSISREVRPLNWMVVSKQAFSPVVQGKGYHMNIEELVNGYDPSYKSLTRYGFEQPDMNVPPHIFILYEKSLRPVKQEVIPQQITANYHARWEILYRDLRFWMDQYMKQYPEVDVYYEDKNIVIYHLERELDKEEI